jgi:uncharacterized membrane protein
MMMPETNALSEDISDDVALDQKIGILLRVGVYTAALVILFGGVLFLIKEGTAHPDYRTFQHLPASLCSPEAILIATMHGNTLSIMQFGMLLLIATPIARVVFSVIAFAVKRDFLYVIISGIVLAVLLYSIIYH